MFHLTRKRRIFTLLGAGVIAGGCAAYAAYSFGWFSTLTQEEEGEDDTTESTNTDDLFSSENEGRKETVDQADITAHVENHFQSIQTIATETTIANLMVQLADHIKSIDHIEEIIEKMRQANSRKQHETLKVHNGGTHVLSVEEKISMWDTVLDGAVCRFVCIVWILPMLQLQIRVQLNILGRTLYLQSSLDKHSIIGSSAQEAFLSIGEYLGKHGCIFLMQKASIIGKKAVAIFKKDKGSLADVVTMRDINRALSAALEMFEKETIRTGDWLGAVIPPNDYVDSIVASIGSAEERERVVTMWRETVAIIQSPEFSCHFLEVCSKQLSGMISKRMEDKITKEMPLVRTIPPLVNEVSLALDTSSEYFSTLSSMQEMEDMSARVYANGSL